MVYITGDIHGDPRRIVHFALQQSVTRDDMIVILGDVAANYDGSWRDYKCKSKLNSLKCPVFCIHGNHEQRPQNFQTYREREWCGGVVYAEDEFPNLLFAKDGEVFELDGHSIIVIGGAYSVDKLYRLENGYGWWPDEQPSDEIKAYVERQLASHRVDTVFSHTCPWRYEPREAFLSSIDQNSVDDSTERWLDKLECVLDYKAWYCGHWHINKKIDKMHFLFDEWEFLE